MFENLIHNMHNTIRHSDRGPRTYAEILKMAKYGLREVHRAHHKAGYKKKKKKKRDSGSRGNPFDSDDDDDDDHYPFEPLTDHSSSSSRGPLRELAFHAWIVSGGDPLHQGDPLGDMGEARVVLREHPALPPPPPEPPP